MCYRHLTPEMKIQLGSLVSPSGFTLEQALRSAEDNPDSGIGVYAGDTESYQLFAPLFDRIIEEYHGHDLSRGHRTDFDAGTLAELSVEPAGDRILSTRVRVGRNLKGVPFPPAVSREERQTVENIVVSSCDRLEGDLAGNYHPLTGMDEKVRRELVRNHFLFKEGDRFLESAGVNRDWPEARGIFLSGDRRFAVWVNEEDHLRIISMQEGGDIRMTFERLVVGLQSLEKELAFACNKRLGFLSSCPTNLGTAMRASVLMRIPEMNEDPKLKRYCDQLRLTVRGQHGEHSDERSGIFAISNRQSLGVSEVESIETLQAGVAGLLEKLGTPQR